MNRKIFLVSTVIIVFVQVSLFAQAKKDSVPSLPSDEVEVIKDFQARLAETQRIQIPLSANDNNPQELHYDYSVRITPVQLDYPAPIIRPISLQAEKPEPSYFLNARLGTGFPHTWLGDLDVTKYLTEDLLLGIQYHHLSARHDKRMPGQYAQNNLHAFADYQLSDAVLLGGFFEFDYDKRDLVNLVSDFEDRAKKSFTGGFQFKSPTNYDSDLSYYSKFEYTRLDISDLNISENWFNLDGGVAYQWGGVKGKLDLTYDFIDNEINKAASIVSVNPSVQYRMDDWAADIGLNYVHLGENNYFLPGVSISNELIENLLVLAIHAQQDVQMNNYAILLKYNPYINQLAQDYAPFITRKFSVEVLGQRNQITYHAEMGYKYYSNAPSFVNAPAGFSILRSVELQEAKAPFVHIGVKNKIQKYFTLGTDLEYQYPTNKEGDLLISWYTFNWKVDGQLDLVQDKLHFDLMFNSFFNIENDVSDESTNWIDLSLHGNYQIHKNLSLFIQANNLLNNSQNLWVGYPNMGIQALGGVQFRW